MTLDIQYSCTLCYDNYLKSATIYATIQVTSYNDHNDYSSQESNSHSYRPISPVRKVTENVTKIGVVADVDVCHLSYTRETIDADEVWVV